MKKIVLLSSLFCVFFVPVFGQKNTLKPPFKFEDFSPKKAEIITDPTRSGTFYSPVQEAKSTPLPSKWRLENPQTTRQEKAKILFVDALHPEEVTVFIKNGRVFLADDIFLCLEEAYELQKLEKGGIINGSNYRWPNGRIPYVLPKDHEAYATILTAIEHLNQKSNLCLFPRTNEVNYVEFVTDENACWSQVGMQGGQQKINISKNCGFGASLHEICHAAGMWHEQSRNDRDNYIRILYENIEEDKVYNFDKKFTTIRESGVYDYNSIMHYGAYAFSKNGKPTIQIKMPPGTASTTIGQYFELSNGDLASLKEMYPNKSCLVPELPIISMYTPFKVSPIELEAGKPFTISTNFVNTSNKTFFGCYVIGLFNTEDYSLVASKSFRDDNGLLPSHIYSNDLVFSGTLNQNQKSGRYLIAAFYYSECTGGTILIDDSRHPSIVEVEVVANNNPTLSVRPSTLNFISTGENKDFTITSNTSWSISESLSWLSVSPGSGSNNQTVTINCVANTSSTSRSGTIIISGTGTESRIITVNQEGVPNCSVPTNVHLVEKGFSHFFINWDPVPGITTYSWRYKKPADANWVTNDAWNATDIISSLKTPCSEYIFQVRSVCNSNNFGEWSPELTFKTDGCNDPYCYSYGIAFSDWIKDVKFGDLSSTSGKNYGYGNFTNKVATLEPGKTYDLELIAGTDEPNSRGSTYYWQVWIDYNQDNDFADAGELVFSNTSTRAISVVGLKSNIAIPSTARPGKTRMRIAISIQSGENACTKTEGSTNFREVEDYTVEFKGVGKYLSATPGAISFPATAETQNISIVSNLSWSVSEAISWLSVSPIVGSNDGQIKVSCVANSNTSTRSGVITISAPGVPDQKITVTQQGIATCMTPKNLKVNQIGDSWFTARWDTVPGNLFVLNYKNGNDTKWSTIDNWDSNDLVWACRTPCSEYVIQVRAKCGTQVSAWTSELRVKTTGCNPTYCHSYGSANVDWIQEVRFADIVKTSFSDFGYGKFLETTSKATRGQTYDLSLLPASSSGSETKTYYCKVWIDYNQNNNFDDPGELVYSSSMEKEDASGGIFGKIKIPIEAKLGKTRIRVALSASDDGPCVADCGTREVEDYSLDIQEEDKYLNVSPVALSLGASAGSGDIDITSNTNWTISTNSSWMSIATTVGSNNGKVTIICVANPSSSSRTANLNISGIGVNSQTISVTQAGANPVLSVDPNSLTFAADGGDHTVHISSNIHWNTTESVDWLSLDAASGVNNGVLTVNCTPNNSSATRSGTIIISGPRVPSGFITVTQTGVTTSICQVPVAIRNRLNSSSALQIGHSWFYVYWDAVAGASRYGVRLRTSGSVSWSEIQNVSTNQLDFKNLSPNTNYEVQVQSFCADGGVSDWSNLFFIKTLGDTWNEVVQTEQSHTVVFPDNISSKIGENPFQINDQIGVFYTEKGTEYCAGQAKWTGKNLAITVYGDDLSTPQKDGFSTQETFKIKVLQASSGNEYTIKAIYAPLGTFGISNAQGDYLNDGVSVVLSLGQDLTLDSQKIPLQAGWNMISSYLVPHTLELDSLLWPIRSSVQLFKNAAGKSFIFSPAINDIGPWSTMEGYRLKVSGADTLILVGQTINSSTTVVPIHPGWQIIPFYGQEAVAIENALSSIREKVIMVKSNAGAVYIPGDLDINTIGNLEPGQGYLLKANQDGILLYATSGYNTKPELRSEEPLQYFQLPFQYNTGQNSTLLFSKKVLEKVVQLNDEIGVFSPSGYLCGAARFSGGHLAITVWGDDTTTPGIQGIQTNEGYNLRIWSDDQQKELVLNSILSTSAYHENDVVMVQTLQLAVSTRTDNEQLTPSAVTLSPNPTNAWIQLYVNQNLSGKVNIRVLGLDGKILQQHDYPQGLVKGQANSLNLSSLPPSIYQIQLRSASGWWAGKVSIVR